LRGRAAQAQRSVAPNKAMKLIISVILLASFTVAAQERGQPRLENNLYYRALGATLDARTVATLDARTRDAKFANANDPLPQVIIQRDIQLNSGFPTNVGEVKIEYLDADDLRERYQSLKHEIPVFVMRPIVNEGDHLVVGFTRYWFTATKKANI
jgi:hypothetical protein